MSKTQAFYYEPNCLLNDGMIADWRGKGKGFDIGGQVI